MNQIELTSAINNFKSVLEKSSEHAKSASTKSEDPSFMDNWYQANWELLVEALLPPKYFLQFYGGGADIMYDNSCRVTFPNELPTHKVVVTPKGLCHVNLLDGQDIQERELDFENFDEFDKHSYSDTPSFNVVLADHKGATVYLDLDKVNFEMVPI